MLSESGSHGMIILPIARRADSSSFQKFPVYFGDRRKRRERIGIFAQDALHFTDLTLADDAYQNRPVLMGIHARSMQFRHAVMQAVHDLRGDLLGMIGNDLKTVRHLETAQDRIARFARYEKGNKREQHGIEFDGDAARSVL